MAGAGGTVRLAVLSDVHSNLPALEVVLEAVEASGAEAVLHAGDVVGYNPYPNEVIHALRDHGVRSIRGNHDRAAVTGDTSWFNPYAAAAIDWTRARLSPGARRYLASLPPALDLEVAGVSIQVVHGSPRDEDEYILPHQASPVLLELAGTEVLVMGHTHVPYVRSTERGLLLNPGSVGQPRDGDPRASWALLDPGAREAEIRRATYDVRAVHDRVLEEGLPPVLAERLLVGR